MNNSKVNYEVYLMGYVIIKQLHRVWSNKENAYFYNVKWDVAEYKCLYIVGLPQPHKTKGGKNLYVQQNKGKEIN